MTIHSDEWLDDMKEVVYHTSENPQVGNCNVCGVIGPAWHKCSSCYTYKEGATHANGIIGPTGIKIGVPVYYQPKFVAKAMRQSVSLRKPTEPARLRRTEAWYFDSLELDKETYSIMNSLWLTYQNMWLKKRTRTDLQSILDRPDEPEPK